MSEMVEVKVPNIGEVEIIDLKAKAFSANKREYTQIKADVLK